MYIKRKTNFTPSGTITNAKPEIVYPFISENRYVQMICNMQSRNITSTCKSLIITRLSVSNKTTAQI